MEAQSDPNSSVGIALISPLRRLSTLLARLSVERGVDGLYQIAFYQGSHIVGGGKCGNNLERIDGAAVEQYTRYRIPQHARIGPDKGAYLLNRGIELRSGRWSR